MAAVLSAVIKSDGIPPDSAINLLGCFHSGQETPKCVTKQEGDDESYIFEGIR